MLRQKTDEFLTEIFLSGKIICKTKIFPIFLEFFPIFTVLTLVPIQKNVDFTRFSGKSPVATRLQTLFHKCQFFSCTIVFL